MFWPVRPKDIAALSRFYVRRIIILQKALHGRVTILCNGQPRDDLRIAIKLVHHALPVIVDLYRIVSVSF